MIEKIFAAEVDLGPIGGDPSEGFGPWGALYRFSNVGVAARHFTSILSKIIGIMTVIAGIWFFFILVIGAFGYLTAGGDSKAVEGATKRISNGLTGLIVIVLAYALISLIGNFLGFDILNPQEIIEQLGP
ncbi:MAG TPA: hypothetical protein VMY36_02910 [Patescibacteria group bacterium]|nr:hypothetical protein [Patescibacteria group bacterium]